MNGPIKIILIATMAATLFSTSGCMSITKSDKLPAYEPRDGDLVFQALPLNVDLIQAIEGITQSHYSHVGVLHRRKGKWTVIEACAPGVIYTPFEKWKTIGRNERWAAYRLKLQYRPLIPKFLRNLHSHAGKPYDFKYEFTDDKLYCSELVFHAWEKTSNKAIGRRENILTLNWKPYLATIEKYNQGPLPASGRMLISPRSLSSARELERVYNHGLDQ